MDLALLIPIVGTVGGIVITVLLGLPLVKVLVRRLEPKSVASESGETRARLERIESAVEGIALEIERIAEAQRYTTRLLAERSSHDTGAR